MTINSIEIEENDLWKSIDYETKRQKAIEQKLGCKFIRIDPDQEEFHILRIINEIFRYIKQSTKETLINKISTSLLRLEFKSDNMIQSKAIKFIIKKYWFTISNKGNALRQL